MKKIKLEKLEKLERQPERMKYEIKNRFSGAVIFAIETKSFKLCVEVAVMSGANLAGANLAGAGLAGANLSLANLSGADLSGAGLSWANLSRANLSGANLAGANLSGADLAMAGLAEGVGYVQVSGIGSARRNTSYRIDTNEVWCGCFHGTLAAFSARIKTTYTDGKFRAQYDAAVAFFTACRVEWEKENKKASGAGDGPGVEAVATGGKGK